jgi:hypothetical protein
MLAAFGATALALSSPAAALAHHGHHRKHKAKAHHARVRFEHFGAGGSVSSRLDGEATTTPTTDTSTGTPSAPSDQDAGKVTSFENEVLTITLNDGTVVQGKVTSRTEIHCIPAEPASNPADEDQESGDEQESGDDKGTGDDESHEGAEEQSSEEQSDSKDDGEAASAPTEAPCDSSALTPGTVVREAELRISSAGSVFESIQLVR